MKTTQTATPSQYKVTAHPAGPDPKTLRAWVIVSADTPKAARELATPTLRADFWGEPFRITKTARIKRGTR